MIHAGYPKRIIAAHSFVSNGNVLKRVVQSMPHVEHAGDVGRWDDNAERRFVRGTICPEVPFFKPEAVPFSFDCVWLVNLFCHQADSLSSLLISSLITFSEIS